MKIGFVGLGKLGLPIAQAMRDKGHDVLGHDVAPREGIATGTLSNVVRHAELIFVAVQTPHHPMYEGVTPLPAKRVDFDYSYLDTALDLIDQQQERHVSAAPVVVISTCLPGNINRIKPVSMRLVYNPFFIAMGTEVRDFLEPEFILMGSDDEDALNMVEDFYATIIDAPVCKMGIEEAELTKVAYNTFISTKLAFVNTLLEVGHKMGVNVDDVTEALCMATRRLISPAYMRPGMGDGGGCHPRDNIALSWLSRELNLGFDFFEAIMMQRQKQAEWLAAMMREHDLPKVILGLEFKRESPLLTGSHARLVQHYLGQGCAAYTQGEHVPYHPAVYLIGMNHDEYASMQFPPGSVVIDPWRYIPDQPGVKVIRLGDGRPA